MTTTTWTFAPAGVLGMGSFDVRPYPGVVVCPTTEAVRGTGLPAVGFTADERATGDVVRLRSLTGPVAVPAHADAPVAQKSIAQQSTQNDATTLGIHTPGRPRS